jgi:hypothetical protein
MFIKALRVDHVIRLHPHWACGAIQIQSLRDQELPFTDGEMFSNRNENALPSNHAIVWLTISGEENTASRTSRLHLLQPGLCNG